MVIYITGNATQDLKNVPFVMKILIKAVIFFIIFFLTFLIDHNLNKLEFCSFIVWEVIKSSLRTKEKLKNKSKQSSPKKDEPKIPSNLISNKVDLDTRMSKLKRKLEFYDNLLSKQRMESYTLQTN